MRHFAALLLLSITVTGCAHLDRIENPPDWPQTWQGRTLFTTERRSPVTTRSPMMPPTQQPHRAIIAG